LPSVASFTSQVRTPGGTFSNLFTYSARVMKSGLTDTTTPVGFVMFDTSGPVELRVTYNGGTVNSAKVWPQAYGITPSINGNVITIPLSGPQNVEVEINGDMYNSLQIFANPLETNIPSPTDPNVMFFRAGLHAYGNDPRITRETVPTHYGGGTATQDVVYVPSGATVDIQGGAIVQAQIKTNPFLNQTGWQNAPRKSNITIRGRGVIDVSRWCGNFTNADRSQNPEMPGIVIFNSDNVSVEGVVVVDPERQQIHSRLTDATPWSVRVSLGAKYFSPRCSEAAIRQNAECGHRSALDDPELRVIGFPDVLRGNYVGVLRSGRFQFLPSSCTGGFHLHVGAGVLYDVLGVFLPPKDEGRAGCQGAASARLVVG
jgi:hypothetical protein